MVSDTSLPVTRHTLYVFFFICSSGMLGLRYRLESDAKLAVAGSDQRSEDV